MKHLIIANPVANQGNAQTTIVEMQAYLNQLDIEYELVITEYPGHAIELAKSSAQAGYERVVAAGGDGTVNEVVNGLMQVKEAGSSLPILGVLTIGRGNDFAFSMGVPADWKVGCQALKDGRIRQIDIGRVESELFPNGRYFCNGVGSGFDTIVGFEAAKMKYLHGMMSYLVAAVKTIFLFQAPRLQIDLDGQSMTQPCAMVSIMNGRRMGGSFLMAPESQGDDGLLDLCIAGDITRMETVGLLPRFMKGTQAGHPKIQFARARKIDIQALDGTIPAHADGETLCTSGKFLKIELLPRQIELLYKPE
ncbi:MAG TPA: diacylglycerol kinase family protein [Anaerolineaceae bacterium]